MNMTPNMNGSNNYQVMTSILKPNQVPSPEQIAKINSFFFCRWLSNNRFTVPIACTLNKYYNMPINMQFRFAQDYSDLTGMAEQVKFIGFVKDQIPKDLEKLLHNIKRFYKISDTTAMDYFKVMDNPTRDKFMEMYNEGLLK